MMPYAIQRACPCCGDDMDACNVVCWLCYHATNRLEADVYHLHPDGTAMTTQGPAMFVSSQALKRWDAQRDEWA